MVTYREFREAEKEWGSYDETSLGAAYGSEIDDFGDAMTYVRVTGQRYNLYLVRLIWQHINKIGWHREVFVPTIIPFGMS